MVKILIIENGVVNGNGLGGILDTLELPIMYSTVRTKNEFFEQLILTDPDLFMAMDPPPGDFSGLDALGFLKRIRSEKPFIIVFENEDEAQALKYSQAGALHYVSKDNMDKLRQVIQQEVENPRVTGDLFYQIFNTDTTGLLVVDREDYHIIMSNNAASSMLGYSSDELNGKSLVEMLSHQGILGEPSLHIDDHEELKLVTANDKSVHISEVGRTFEIQNRSVKMITVCEVHRDDLSNKTLNRNETEWFDQIIPTLRALAHHFQNSYTIIGGYHALLEKGNPTEARSIFTKVKGFLENDTNVLERLGKVTDSAIHDNVVNVDLNQIVRNVIRVIQAKILNDTTSLNVVGRLEPTLPALTGQEKALYDMVACLGQNAVEACESDAVISFKTAHNDENIILTVSDTGRGMDRDLQETCFRPFVTTKRSHGAGLGLSIVFGVVQRHGGELFISTKEGKGTTVRVLIPIKHVTN
jgi:PAS domain S-box-containing protein